MKQFWSSLILLLLINGIYAQNQLYFPLNREKPKLTILSEYHGIAGTPLLKSLMIEQLYDSAGVQDVVLEMSTAVAYLGNEYIQTGNNDILEMLYPGDRKSTLLENLRSMYLQGKHICLHGIDFERMEFVIAIRYLFEKMDKTGNDLYRHIISLPPSLIDRLRKDETLREQRKKVLNDAYTVYKADKPYYDAIIDNGFSVKDIFENPASEIQFAKRDMAMAKNIAPVVANAAANLLLIIGGSHIESKGKLYNRMLKDKTLNKNDISIISMLCKDCEARGMYFEKKRVPYLGNASFLADTAATNKIFTNHRKQDTAFIIPADDVFWSKYQLKKDNDLNYIMLVDCSKQ